MTNEQELRERRNERKSGVDNSYWAINDNREKNIPPVSGLRALSHKAVEVASCELRLGNTSAAREWFARAAYANIAFLDLFVERWDDLTKSKQSDGGNRAQVGIYSAVLAGDSRLIGELTEQVLNLTDDYPSNYGGTGEYYWKACTVASLLRDDNAAAEDFRQAYFGVLDDTRPHAIALSETQRGLIRSERKAVETGIQRLVDHHDSVYEEMRPWNQLVNKAGAAHLLIARNRGMDINVDSEYFPPALDEYGIDEQIDLPVPEYLDDDLRVD
jgi:hypothetical protein